MGTKATREELGDLGVVYARLFEFVKNGKRPAGLVIAGMQRLADAQLQEEAGLDRYNHLLLSLSDQRVRLRRYNAMYWGNRLTAEQLASVDTSSDHTQSVDDLEMFHVEFRSYKETVEMWWKVYVGEQPYAQDGPKYNLDRKHLCLCPNTANYEPGISRVRINLVAHWEPKNGRTLNEVRDYAKITGEVLAHTEVLSAYGIHYELLREQDGENLPYSELAGTVVTIPGKSMPGTLYLCWSTHSRSAFLTVSLVFERILTWSAPVVLEVQR